MHGLLSLLDQEHSTFVYQIWEELEQSCGLTGVKVTPFPHFSWLTAEDFDWVAIDAILKEIASEMTPFQVQTTALSVFTGENPVVYVPLVRTAELSFIHKMIWDRISPFGVDLSPYYSPKRWMPHITIAFGDVTPITLPCLMERLVSRNFDWEISVDNLATGFQSAGTAIIQNRYEFKT